MEPKTSEKSKIGLNLPLCSALSPAGDVLLVLWKASRSQLSNIITLVAEYSLSLQRWFEYTCSRVGLELQLKIGTYTRCQKYMLAIWVPKEHTSNPFFFSSGLSAGHISQLIVGDEKRQYLLVTGQQVDDAWLAQSLAETGEVILSPNCWELCKQDILEAKKIPGQKAVEVGAPLILLSMALISEVHHLVLLPSPLKSIEKNTH